MPVDASAERLTHGDSRTDQKDAGIDTGENQAAANCIGSSKVGGSGKWNMGQSQMGTTSTTLMEIHKTMTCPTCRSCLHLPIIIYTNGDERITESSLMEQKQDGASGAVNTNHLTNILSARLGHIMATAKIVKENTSENGARKTQPIAATTCASGGKNNVSRFFFQADWSHEIAERLAAAEPVRYVAKASRKERDAGLEEWEARLPGPETLTAGIERKNAKRRPERKSKNPLRNHWPTVKPIALTRWLATLLLPPSEYAPRRIVIPFCGSGSEGAGAGLVGWDEMTLIDSSEEACALAEARLAHWLKEPRQPELEGL